LIALAVLVSLRIIYICWPIGGQMDQIKHTWHISVTIKTLGTGIATLHKECSQTKEREVINSDYLAREIRALYA